MVAAAGRILDTLYEYPLRKGIYFCAVKTDSMVAKFVILR